MAPAASRRQKERKDLRTAQKSRLKEEKKIKNELSELSIEELIKAAEQSSITDENLQQAIDLYSRALSLIQQQINPGGNEMISKERKNDRIIQTLEVLEKRAELYVNLCLPEKALEDYKYGLRMIPEVNDNHRDVTHFLELLASFNMYIGQLSEGYEALTSYEKGVMHLERAASIRRLRLNTAPEVSESDNMNIGDDETESFSMNHPRISLIETNKKLSSAYCAICELCMTDLCYEPNAESMCESYVQKALLLSVAVYDNEPSVDALQLAASHRLSQNRSLEAVEYILNAYEQMKIGCEALSKIVGLQSSSADTNGDENQGGALELQNLTEVQNLPTFEVRSQTAKLLLECSNAISDICSEDVGQEAQSSRRKYIMLKSKCADCAVNVLGSLIAENDEVAELWNLLGDAFALNSQNDYATNDDDNKQVEIDLAMHYWKRAIQLFEVVQKTLLCDLKQATCQDDEDQIQMQLDEIVCSIDEIRSKVESLTKNDDVTMEA